MRLRSDFWVSAYMRRRQLDAISCVLRRRGAAEAGAIFVIIDHLDGTSDLYGPAPQSLVEGGLDRSFIALMSKVSPSDIQTRFDREIKFDPDIWIIEVEDRSGVHHLDLVEG